MTFTLSSKGRLTDRDLERFPTASLFDRIARAVCHAGCLPRKELYEAWEMARRVRRVFRGGRIVDLAAGHGLLAHVLLILDDSSPRALCVDTTLPPSSGKLHEVLLMGLLTFYLVATAWLTTYRRRPQTNLADWFGLAVVVAVAVGLANSGMEAANSATGTKDGSAAGLYFAFLGVASLAAVLDVRMIWQGGVSGAQRLTRHLWRMCTALFIAVGSFFLGQPQVFPVAIRNSGILAVPTLLVILSGGYWLFRVNAFSRLLPHNGRSAPGLHA